MKINSFSRCDILTASRLNAYQAAKTDLHSIKQIDVNVVYGATENGAFKTDN